MPLIGRRYRIESVFTTRGPGAATRGPCSSPATAREEPRTSGEFEDGFNPWEILRISRGTSFLGMVVRFPNVPGKRREGGGEGEVGESTYLDDPTP